MGSGLNITPQDSKLTLCFCFLWWLLVWINKVFSSLVFLHSITTLSITIYRNDDASAAMIKFITGLRNIRILILSILIGLLVIPIWSSSTGFSYVVDSSGQPSLGNNSSNENNKFVVLTFDDGWKSQYTNAKPILDTYGYKASFSIICEDVGKPDHMNWEEINTLEDEGHDIGSHSMTHRSLTEMPPEEMMFEVSGSKQCLIDNGIEDINYFSYPKNEGSADKAVIETVLQHYDLAKTANDPLMYLHCDGFKESTQTDCKTYTEDGELTFVNRYSMMGWSHDSDRIRESLDDSQTLQMFVEVMNSATDYNKDKGIVNAIPIIIYHKIDNTRGNYSTSLDLFESEMRYLNENGFTVLNMADLGYDENTNYLYIREENPTQSIIRPAEQGNEGATQPQTCEVCFSTFLTQEQVEDLSTSSIATCDFLEAEHRSEEDLREALQNVGVGDEEIDSLIECLEAEGIRFL
jgi:peptidoglycan/xylan/chitin deacetylase (PgdA/CDA1 family)